MTQNQNPVAPIDEAGPMPVADPWAADSSVGDRDGQGTPAGLFTSRYVVGLAAIALFAIVSAILVSRALAEQEADARAIAHANRLSALSLELGSVAEDLTAPMADAARVSELEDIADEIRTDYLGLQFGDDSLGLTAAESAELRAMFESVDPAFFAMLENVSWVLESPAPTVLTATLNNLAAQAELVRYGVESIAFQYEREAEASLENLKQFQLLLIGGILVLVVLEGIFLFRPVAKLIRSGWDQREEEHAEQQERSREQLNYMAQFDPLTGLANRVLLRDRLEHAMARARRDGTFVSLMFIDLDDFKSVNDQFGHDIGDQLLKQVAQRLLEVVRESDTVARLGGDEFTVVLEGAARPEAAAHVAQKILKALEKPFLLLGRQLHMSGSVGIVIFPLDGDSIDSLMRDADMAMYSAKEAGKNNYQFFTEDLRAETSERLQLLDSLRRALNRDDELWLAYQPKVSIGDRRIVGVEALIRWNHPEKGQIPPGQFIPLAEDTEMILRLGEWVLEEACAQAREWQDAGLRELKVSVNVAARQLMQGDLADIVARVLRDTGVDPWQIELELTEGTLMEDSEITIRTLKRLKKMGLRISVDDFGTGYSSLSYLKQFPLDYLKIDQSFVSDLTSDPEDIAIPTAVIRLAHSLRLEVVAEGVETAKQLELLHELGCDFMQGYLISKPVPANQVEDLARLGLKAAV